MAVNYFQIGSLLLGLVALALFIASWLISRKTTPTEADRRLAGNLQLAGLISLLLALISGAIFYFRPNYDQKLFTRSGTISGGNEIGAGLRVHSRSNVQN